MNARPGANLGATSTGSRPNDAPLFGAGGSSNGEQLLAGGLDTAETFDPMLTQLFDETGAGNFQGIWRNRQVDYTKFDDDDLAIYFRRDADITGRVVGEEVQHAIDFAMGGTRCRIAAAAAAQGIPEADIVQWWHRRVFTRLIQNIHSNQFGLGILQQYVDDIFRQYQQQGGGLGLDEIFSQSFSGLY